ncbi:uncharacterized protein EV422DRAFT_569913 [Fimicolochytrium jonesii]|uniref:uncharacterized protein n=1 Tax=Fimicolochytrium jonesii TaxID=1396493 RepID=UPI0022FEB4D3|nr:uncharacterized protein EV422DRAFT_569913 [Fimicolochytrium jonesii]KAI8818126.1 hypothetical protein EV422DRAFT_569913 [Fimicolochytrium jonesii]
MSVGSTTSSQPTTTALPPPSFPSPSRQKELGEMWERAVQCIRVPLQDCGGGEEVEDVFIQGLEYIQGRREAMKEWPEILREGVWYMITAWNSMGATQPAHINQAANELLHSRLSEVFPSKASPRILEAYGTDDTEAWREDGFAVHVSTSTIQDQSHASEEEVILGLGREFGQVALYRLEWVSDAGGEGKEVRGRMIQRVVACYEEMRGVESDIEVGRR